MLRDRLAVAAIVALMAGCGFDIAATSDGGIDDGPDIDAAPLPTVGFAQASMTQDETSGTLMIEVTLSSGATGEVTVPYSFSGSAILGQDYTATPGTLTFALGETTKLIPVEILPDQVDENIETILITLGAPTGAMLGTTTHAIEIAANTLARVNLSTATSMVDEATAVTITLSLDKAADAPSTVTYTVTGGTAQGSGTFADYTLASGVVNFPMGTTVQTLPLGVVNDSRNELAETLTITLTTTTGVVIGTTAPAQVHTILDDDAVPAVRFDQASSMTTEGNTGTTQVMLNVTLTAASGRTIVVPFAVTAAMTTATAPADYTLVGSTITFAEGVTSVPILVNVVGDTVSEPTEELVLAIQAPADGSATLGAQSTRRLSINDNDPWCQGTGNFQVCYPTLPTAPVVLPATINTSGGAPCGAQPTDWNGQGQPGACFIVGTSITMSGTTVVTGSRPLVLVASQDITISQTLDAAAHVGVAGPAPGAPFSSCPAFLATPGGFNGAGGGAGATFMTQGGNGGTGDGGSANPAGIAPGASAAPTLLRAGCDGQRGGNSGNTAGVAGAAGGVVYLVAGGTIMINGAINVSGSAGRGGGNFTGGSGAGSGGMIWLHAAAINAAGGTLMANGGGGSSGGDNNASGSDGSDPLLPTSQTPALGGPSGSAGAAGGTGFAGATPAAAGGAGDGSNGGGGGGGGGGYIKASSALTGAAGVSAGLIQAP